MLIGSISDWLPSRRSVLIQIGACSIVRLGHFRPVRRTAGKGRYFSAGLRNMIVSLGSLRRMQRGVASSGWRAATGARPASRCASGTENGRVSRYITAMVTPGTNVDDADATCI